MGNWLNSDGLYLEFGTDKATPTRAGEFTTYGALREIEMRISLASVTDTGIIVSDTTFMPKCRIEEVEVVVVTAATGATATLDLGLIQTNRSTEIDFDGLLTNVAVTSMDAAGEKVVYRVGTAGAGALIGTTVATPGYFHASWDTAAFTAGEILVRVRYTSV